MKTFIMNDGEIYEAEGSRDLIRQIRSRAPFGMESNQRAWMRGVARSVRQTTGRKLDIRSETRFVRGLISAGLLTEKEGCAISGSFSKPPSTS